MHRLAPGMGVRRYCRAEVSAAITGRANPAESRMPTARFLAAAFCTLLLTASLGPVSTRAAAAGAGRTALVIANAAYPDSDAPLPTPINDARALGDALKRRGFTVVAAENANREAMQAAIDRFLKGVEPDGIALVFFGGYGIQAGRKNYLIPVDARIWSEADVGRDGIAVDTLLDDLAKRRAGIRVTVLDASRRNPFERRFRSFSQGLAPAPAQPGTLTLSAAAAGAVVNEGSGPRSAFVTELVQQVGTDQTADQAFAATRDTLGKRGRAGQEPALSVNLDETFSFDPDRPRVAVGKAASAADDPAARAKEAREEAREKEARAQAARDREAREAESRDRETRERETRDREKSASERAAALAAEQAAARDFETARAKGTRAAYQDFLDRYPAGPTADRARGEIARIETEGRAVADYDAADAKGTAAAYRDFLDRHAAGPLAARARAALERLAALDRRKADQERQRLAELDGRIARNARDDEAYYERGQFHAQRGEAAAALADFDTAIRLNPASPEAFNNRCWMRAMADDLKMALTDCNEALKLRPGFLDAFDSRGLVHLKAGSLRAAISDYGEALKLDPRHSSALYGRGLARKRLGDDSQAGRDMASALELNPQIDKEFASYGLR